MDHLPTVLIVDRPGQGISLNLQSSEFHAVEVFHSGKEFLEVGVIERPACLIIDMQLTDMSGLALLEQVRRDSDLPVIMTAEHLEVADVLQCMRLGVLDVCPKPLDAQTIQDLVRRGLEEDAETAHFQNRIQDARNKLAKLTERQRQLLTFFANGSSRKEIAVALKLSLRTVEHHREHINTLLGTDRLAHFVQLNLLAGGTRAIFEIPPKAVKSTARHFRIAPEFRSDADLLQLE